MNDKQLTNREYELIMQIYHEMHDSVFIHLPEDIFFAFFNRLYSKK